MKRKFGFSPISSVLFFFVEIVTVPIEINAIDLKREIPVISISNYGIISRLGDIAAATLFCSVILAFLPHTFFRDFPLNFGLILKLVQTFFT